MTRFESTVALAILGFLAGVHAPAFGQYIVIDGASGGIAKPVTPEVKGPNGKQKSARGGKAEKAEAARLELEKATEPTFTVEGDFQKTKEKARESAIRAAVDRLHTFLMEQDPPITRMPTTDLVRRTLIESQEKVTEETFTSEVTGEKTTQYRMTVAVKIDPVQVRELRSRERSSEALWVLAGLAGLAGVGALFFRVDAWTKGYLTSWLALGTVGAATLLAGLWWWAK